MTSSLAEVGETLAMIDELWMIHAESSLTENAAWQQTEFEVKSESERDRKWPTVQFLCEKRKSVDLWESAGVAAEWDSQRVKVLSAGRITRAHGSAARALPGAADHGVLSFQFQYRDTSDIRHFNGTLKARIVGSQVVIEQLGGQLTPTSWCALVDARAVVSRRLQELPLLSTARVNLVSEEVATAVQQIALDRADMSSESNDPRHVIRIGNDILTDAIDEVAPIEAWVRFGQLIFGGSPSSV